MKKHTKHNKKKRQRANCWSKACYDVRNNYEFVRIPYNIFQRKVSKDVSVKFFRAYFLDQFQDNLSKTLKSFGKLVEIPLSFFEYVRTHPYHKNFDDGRGSLLEILYAWHLFNTVGHTHVKFDRIHKDFCKASVEGNFKIADKFLQQMCEYVDTMLSKELAPFYKDYAKIRYWSGKGYIEWNIKEIKKLEEKDRKTVYDLYYEAERYLYRHDRKMEPWLKKRYPKD